MSNPPAHEAAGGAHGPGTPEAEGGLESLSPPLVEARGACKSYTLGRRSLDVLQEVDLVVRRGEFIALQGASGAGKSTLLHLLGGLDSPTRGAIRFGQTDLAGLSPLALSRLRNRRLGFVFQAYHLLPELDAIENVCLPARMCRMPTDAAFKRGRELLSRVGLADRMGHRPYELSGGEQQRVAIARALINEPELVLADEPTGNLDSKAGEGVMELLLSLRTERQLTLVVATHDGRVACRAPKVFELKDGRIASASSGG